jgi:hypothetical protein
VLFACPECKATREVDDRLAGKLVSCPACSCTVHMPGDPGGARGRIPEWLKPLVQATRGTPDASQGRRPWGVISAAVLALAIILWLASTYFAPTAP